MDKNIKTTDEIIKIGKERLEILDRIIPIIKNSVNFINGYLFTSKAP
jgi:hypothetical protein